jgi:hypothetical protein
MPADRHRQATYDAETAAFDHTAFEIPVGLYGLAKLSVAISRTSWWQARHRGRGAPTLRQARPDSRRSSASTAQWTIRFCHRHDTVATLTHELAHFSAEGDGHGPVFRRDHIDLIGLAAGPDASRRLARAYRLAGLAVADADPTLSGVDDTGESGLLSACGDVISAPAGDSMRHAERVNKLLAKAATTTEAEAEALRSKAFELSVRHGIDAALLDAARGNSRIVERPLSLGAGPYVAARTLLVDIIARHLGCEVFWVSHRHGRTVTVVGYDSDATEVMALFAELDHAALLGALNAPLVGNRQSARRQYLFGFAAGVGRQLSQARQTEGLDDGTNPAALVLVERRQAVHDHVTAVHRPSAERASKVARDNGAYDAGRRDGQQARVERRQGIGRGAVALPTGH